MNITLSTPAGLFGLLSLPLILALHLFRSRSRARQVSSLTLWKFLTPQLRGTSARKLPLTWLLLIDLLIATLLSFALAGPRLDITRPVDEGRHLVFILDTSTSMAAADEAPDRFTAALRTLQATAASGSERDAVTVITFSDTASTAADSRDPDFPDQWRSLQDIQPAGAGANINAALALARASIDRELPAEVHIFTDAAFTAPDMSGYDLPVEWHLTGRSDSNQAVLTLTGTVLSPLKFQVFARFANFSRDAVTRPFTLTGDGQVLASGEITIEADASIAQSWELVGSVSRLGLVLDGNDSLAADDAAYTALLPGEGTSGGPQVSVALVTRQPGPLQRALEAAPETAVQVIDPADYLPGSRFDLIVFQGYLPERWPGGSVLVVEPPADSALLGPAAGRAITELPVPAPARLLDGVDFTGVRWETALALEQPLIGADEILASGQTPLILHGQVGLTGLVVLLVPVSGPDGAPTAFARHPAFPVLVANIVQDAAGLQLPAQTRAGAPILLPEAERYPSLRIVRPNGEEEAFGASRPVRWEGASVPGFYSFSVSDIDGLEQVFQIGVNAGDLSESDIEPGVWPAGAASPPLPAAATGQPLSLVPWLVAAAAVLLLLEAWLAWRKAV